jgi:hypothetical protein
MKNLFFVFFLFPLFAFSNVKTPIDSITVYPKACYKSLSGDEAVIRFIEDNIRFPTNAKRFNVQAEVYVSYVVEKDLSITNVEIRDEYYSNKFPSAVKEIRFESIRVVSLIPYCRPGYDINGVPLRTMYTIPIKFFYE